MGDCVKPYIRVRNFWKFQHYKDRNPRWVKFYLSLIWEPEYQALTEVQRWHLDMMFLLAGEFDNNIPNKPSFLASRIGATSSIDLDALHDHGWIEYADKCDTRNDASNLLAGCYQDAIPETETETDNTPHSPRKRGVRSESKTGEAGNPANEPTEAFKRFWASYPHGVRASNPKRCIRHWNETKLDDQIDAIISAIETSKRTAEWQRDNGRYIPKPLKWLRGETWRDLVSRKGQRSSPSQTRASVAATRIGADRLVVLADEWIGSMPMLTDATRNRVKASPLSVPEFVEWATAKEGVT